MSASRRRAVDEPRAAHVAIDLPALEHHREPELREHGGAAVVGEPSPAGSPPASVGRRDEPADPQRRRERLADRAHVDDALRVEPLQRPDGLAVVAVLGVVVVLEHEGVAARSPTRAAPRAARGASTTPVGYWWAGVTSTASHVAALERVDVEPVVVDRDGDPLQPGRGDRRPQVGAPGLLDGDPPHAARGQRPAREREPLGQARGHHDGLGVGGHAAHAAEVGRRAPGAAPACRAGRCS